MKIDPMNANNMLTPSWSGAQQFQAIRIMGGNTIMVSVPSNLNIQRSSQTFLRSFVNSARE